MRVGGFAFHVAGTFGGPSHVFLGQAVMACKRAFDQRVDAALEPVGVALHGPFPRSAGSQNVNSRPSRNSRSSRLWQRRTSPWVHHHSCRVAFGLDRSSPRVGAFLQESLPLAVPVVQCAAPRRRLAGVPHLRRCVGEPLEFLPCLQPGP